MRVVLYASGEFAVPTIRWFANSPHEVVALVSQPSRPSGRGCKATPTPAAEWAEHLGMPVVESADVNDAAFVARIRDLNARLGVVIAFGQKLGPALLAAPTCGCVNLHGSLLPKYRGAAPIAWAILCGEAKTGVTVFRLANRMDAGEILVKRETLIGPDETAGNLHDRLAMIGPDAIGAMFRLFEQSDSPPGERQDDRGASIAPKLNKAAGRLDFERGAIKLARHVRAMTPWPGARCLYASADGQRREEVAIALARVAEAASPAAGIAPGTLLDNYHVCTGDGQLKILEIQPTGKRVMTWQDFVNGRHVSPGDRFEALPAPDA